MTSFQRTASWLKACGKEPSPENLSVQIGCHIEEFVEFLQCVQLPVWTQANSASQLARDLLTAMATSIKTGRAQASIGREYREKALDALCDMEVTGNGVAYLAGFDKEKADQEVLAANDRKLVDGRPVIREGGQIGKPMGWVAADLRDCI